MRTETRTDGGRRIHMDLVFNDGPVMRRMHLGIMDEISETTDQGERWEFGWSRELEDMGRGGRRKFELEPIARSTSAGCRAEVEARLWVALFGTRSAGYEVDVVEPGQSG